MAAKKMFLPRAIENVLGDDYEEFKLGIGLRIQAGQVVMQFSDHVGRIRMSSAGARQQWREQFSTTADIFVGAKDKMAAMLIEKADEQDRLGRKE